MWQALAAAWHRAWVAASEHFASSLQTVDTPFMSTTLAIANPTLHSSCSGQCFMLINLFSNICLTPSFCLYDDMGGEKMSVPFLFLDCWVQVLQQTFYSCPALCLCNLVVALAFWSEMRMSTLLLVLMMSCWMTFSMSRAVPGDKQVKITSIVVNENIFLLSISLNPLIVLSRHAL